MHLTKLLKKQDQTNATINNDINHRLCWQYMGYKKGSRKATSCGVVKKWPTDVQYKLDITYCTGFPEIKRKGDVT
jgi:hypothetical protein